MFSVKGAPAAQPAFQALNPPSAATMRDANARANSVGQAVVTTARHATTAAPSGQGAWERMLFPEAEGGLRTGAGASAPVPKAILLTSPKTSVSSTFKVPVLVVKKGAYVRFSFSTTGGDILFEATFTDEADEAVSCRDIVKERQRHQSQAKAVEVTSERCHAFTCALLPPPADPMDNGPHQA